MSGGVGVQQGECPRVWTGEGCKRVWPGGSVDRGVWRG